MWETMQNANGCGLAAPQIGQTKQLFIVDSTSVYQLMDAEDREHYFESEDHGIKETFINARITDYSDELWDDYEGCLSIPGFLKSKKTLEYKHRIFKRRFTITTTQL